MTCIIESAIGSALGVSMVLLFRWWNERPKPNISAKTESQPRKINESTLADLHHKRER